ncbi:P-loop containing nucleoside triphosphate hydrolase protein [Aspergillus pseudotamarii]|uniref:P-loop containing nucleoside triphosphate hydrolase protein n=1 Tax=Aspergillus pseudotamarii TaxID=132259 RepID=A0A5N6SYK1_ASPPS|nr:P-loop containing nucleoside triphosphate hydrolase protein [Aspergillus pseudotamarii]KAE8138859.1 P-loop containing nucleoside triphosphate hydrolase protein [Aspergillus pseudotamarii]
MSTEFRSEIIEFSRNLQSSLGWYNAFEPDTHGVLSGKPENLRKHRESCITLHGYQSFECEVICAFSLRPVSADKFRDFGNTNDTTFRFALTGGNETPAFRVNLCLQGKKRAWYFRLLWTASGEKGFQTARPDNVATEIPAPGFYTFSNRLQSVQWMGGPTEILNEYLAQLTRGKAGSEYYQVYWTHSQPPVAYGFDVPQNIDDDLSTAQKTTLHFFRRARDPDMSIRIATRARATLMDAWKRMCAMPVPTFAAYPLYDCRYVVEQARCARMRNIPPITDPLVEAHHRRRVKGWMNTPPGYDRVTAIVSVPVKYAFINEREYEVIRTIGLRREAEHQKSQYIGIFNHEYAFDIYPVSTIHGNRNPVMDEYFYGLLEVTPAPGAASNTFTEQSLAIPEPGTYVVVTERRRAASSSAGENKWPGVLINPPKLPPNITVPPNFVCIRIKRPERSDATGNVLRLEGNVSFGREEAAFVQLSNAIQAVMYGNKDLGVPRNNPLKTLLLGRDNYTICLHRKLEALPTDATSYLDRIRHRMNVEQYQAVESALSVGETFRELVTLVTGPPGTGKTSVSARIALYHYETKKPLLIVCGSNQGLDVISKRILKSLGLSNELSGPVGIFRLDTEYQEEAESQFAPGIQAGSDTEFVSKIRSDLGQLGISDEEFNLLRSSVESSTSKENKLSLGHHIIQRLDYAKWLGSRWLESEDEEVILLWTFLTYQEALARRGFLFLEDVSEGAADYRRAVVNAADTLVGEDSAEMLANLITRRKAAWRELQRFYLKRARIVLCTASTAGRKEASQLTEATAVNGIARYLGSVKKIVLSGDIRQLGPTVTSIYANEFYDFEKLSLFERLLSQDVPDVKLLRQYRMTPQIAQFPNKEFYGDRLVTDPTADTHCMEFQAVMKERYGVKSGDCYFLSITHSSLWRRRNASSMFNPEYVAEVTELARAFINASICQEDILILSYYSEEIRVLKQAIHGILKYGAVEIKSVDSAQGSEARVVILSTTRPGGSLGMGFVADRQRQNVAITRARQGLVIVGHAGMGNSSSAAAQSWVKLVQHYRENGRLISTKGNRHNLVNALKIPNEKNFTQVTAR